MDGVVMQATTASVLPLRQDLRLYQTAAEKDGTPVWVIQDPVSNRFFRIGWVEYECLLRWPNPPEVIAAAINAETALHIDAETVQAFAQFLEQNYLVRPSAEGIQRIKQHAHQKGWRTWRWWLRNYLFIRLPLVRPQRLLNAVLPWVEPLFSRTALVLVLSLSVIGILMVIQQWDIFAHSVVDLLNPAGIMGFVIALVLSKGLHEMAHALVATRQGVRVAHMGVAFLVLWPMLYTDTGESWRLRSHQQRLAISVAGVSVELALAGVATFFWAVLSDGVWRDAMLYLATTAWVVSLAINASPFMRFDGYFILSDVLGFPNLHERAAAVARVRLRRWVLGINEAYPEAFSVSTARWLSAFAYLTWLYRLGVFLAIAWAVYTLFFKVLGIILLVVELAWFVWRPVWSELVEWKKRWPLVKKRRRWLLASLVFSVLLVMAVPWSVRVEAPAVLLAERQQFVYAPYAAQLRTIHASGKVAANTALVQLDAPDLIANSLRAEALKAGIAQRLIGLIADEKGHETHQALLQRFAEQQAEIAAVHGETQRLNLRAEFAGDWVDTDPSLKAGTWVNEKQALGVLIDPTRWVIDAYVTQHDIHAIRVGDTAHFYVAGQWQPIKATVIEVDSTRVQRHFPQVLDAAHGGSITTHQRELDQETVPVQSRYRVRLQVNQPVAPYERVGQIQIHGEPRSWLWDKTQAWVSLLIRESGF